MYRKANVQYVKGLLIFTVLTAVVTSGYVLIIGDYIGKVMKFEYTYSN